MPESFSEAVDHVIATEVRRHRERAGLTAQALSERCAQLGHPISRASITNLENGRVLADGTKRRPAATVADLLTYARALDVPPLLLLSPELYSNESSPVSLEWLTNGDPISPAGTELATWMTAVSIAGSYRANARRGASEQRLSKLASALWAARFAVKQLGLLLPKADGLPDGFDEAGPATMAEVALQPGEPVWWPNRQTQAGDGES